MVTVSTDLFRIRMWLAALLLVPLLASFAPAQEKEPKNESDTPLPLLTGKPLAIVNFAGLDRLLGDLDYTFASVEREDVGTQIKSLLQRVNDLEGIDRSRPFGLMIFLSADFPPSPVVVAYVPVKEIEDVAKTVESIGGKFAESDEGENLYQIKGIRGSSEPYVLHQGDYLFVSEQPEDLEREFSDPEKMTRTLSSRYDAAFSLNLKAVPEGARTAFLFYLRGSAEANLQQRDGEPDDKYQARKVTGQRTLELFEQLLTQGESIIAGVNFSEQDRHIRAEVALDATPDSKFAEYLADIGGKRSYFARMLESDAALTGSSSWSLDKEGQQILAAALRVGEGEVGEELVENEEDENPAKGIFESLKATAESGHLDIFMQMQGNGPGEMVLVGGARVEKDRELADSMAAVLNHIREREGDDFAELELGIDEHEGVVFHKIRRERTRRQDERLYGEDHAFYVGAGSKAIWFALGGDGALPALKNAIDTVLAPRKPGENKDPNAPFQLVMNMGTWARMGPPSDPDRPRPMREVAEQAFEFGGDRLRVELKPTERGLRLRFTLEEGFIRMIGLGVSRRFDRARPRL